MNRRQFLSGMVAGGAAPLLFNGCIGGFAANRKINVGVIGYGRIAHTMDVPGVQQFTDRCVVTAVAEYDAERAAYGKKVIEERYAKKGIVQEVKTYGDYREMIADKSIDAVLLCIPDHQHAIVATDCLLAGKHIYLQKPFAQTVQEGRIVANIAKKKGLVVQVGAWQRSRPQFRKVVNLVRNGRLGKIARVEVGIGCDRSGGDRRAHHLDITAWGLGCDPSSVRGTCEWMDLSGNKLWNVHTTYDLHYDCGGADVHVNNKFQMGVKFIGENGDWLWCTRGAMKVTPSDPDPKVAPGQLGPIEASKPSLLADLLPCEIKDNVLAHGGERFLTSDDHFLNFLEAVAREDPQYTVCDAEGAHRSTAFCSLGRMCMELGRGKSEGRLSWNAAKETTGNAEADKMLVPFARGRFDLKLSLKAAGLDYAKFLKPMA